MTFWSYKTSPKKSIEFYENKNFIIVNKAVYNFCTVPKKCKPQTLPQFPAYAGTHYQPSGLRQCRLSAVLPCLAAQHNINDHSRTWTSDLWVTGLAPMTTEPGVPLLWLLSPWYHLEFSFKYQCAIRIIKVDAKQIFRLQVDVILTFSCYKWKKVY